VADLVMPGMSGLELGRALRAEHPELPILYISGYEPQDSAGEDSESPSSSSASRLPAQPCWARFEKSWTQNV